MIDSRYIWNVSYNARSNRSHPPTSPNIPPAMKNHSHDWLVSHMKRQFKSAEQQDSPSNVTKYCACHAKWLSGLILVTYETALTQQHPPSNVTKYGAFHENGNHLQCAADTTMIRPCSDHEPVSPQPAAQRRLLLAHTRRTLYGKTISLNFTKKRTCHEMWHLNLPNSAAVATSNTSLYYSLYYYLTLLLHDFTTTWICSTITWFYFDSTFTWLYYYLTLLLLDSTITWLYDNLTLPLLDSTVT